MSKKNKSLGDNGHRKSRQVKMAYSLNNWQPVQCTIISDQPFFYMDEECHYDDELLCEDGLYEDYDLVSEETLMAEISSMKDKIKAYDKTSAVHVKQANQTMREFEENIFSFSQEIPTNKNSLNNIISRLKKSRFASELLSFAKSQNIQIELNNNFGASLYDTKINKIFIQSNTDITTQVLLLVQELRRVWQHGHDALVNALSLNPDQAVLINRSQKSDLAVSIIRAAWEMKLNGENAIWSRIEQSSMADLGRSLAREAIADFRTLNNGKAMAAVFETWFLSERCKNEDKILIRAMLADYRGYVYGYKENSEKMTASIICKLGEQPFGKNYLATYAQMIMNDPLFTEVRDRSNANFLWFIKFEHSFQEKEQELQSSSSIKIADIDQLHNNKKFEDNQNEGQFTPAAEQRFNREIYVDESLQPRNQRNNVIEVQFGQSM